MTSSKRKAIIKKNWNTSSGKRITAMLNRHWKLKFEEEDKHAEKMIKFAQDIMV